MRERLLDFYALWEEANTPTGKRRKNAPPPEAENPHQPYSPFEAYLFLDAGGWSRGEAQKDAPASPLVWFLFTVAPDPTGITTTKRTEPATDDNSCCTVCPHWGRYSRELTDMHHESCRVCGSGRIWTSTWPDMADDKHGAGGDRRPWDEAFKDRRGAEFACGFTIGLHARRGMDDGTGGECDVTRAAMYGLAGLAGWGAAHLWIGHPH